MTSHIVGLFCACLGEGLDSDRRGKLAQQLGFAIKLWGRVAEQQRLIDFHVAQVPISQPRLHECNTRREEVERYSHQHATLSKFYRPEPIVSNRHYILDCPFVVTAWGEEALLRELAAALVNPKKIPYAGRKSCALALPMAPWITDGGLFYALDGYPLDSHMAPVVARLLPEYWMREGNHVEGVRLDPEEGPDHVIRDHTFPVSPGRQFRAESWRRIIPPHEAASEPSGAMMTTAQVAECLGISPTRVRQIAATLGGIRSGRDWQFPAEAVAAYAKSDRPKPGRPPKRPNNV
ncbi:hypothetical protein JCM15519_07010 [Fundidesulfovibrio butyratiphilus]